MRQPGAGPVLRAALSNELRRHIHRRRRANAGDGMKGVLAMVSHALFDPVFMSILMFEMSFWSTNFHLFWWSFHIVGDDLRWCFCTFKESVIFSAGYCLDSNTNPNRLVEWTRPSCRQFDWCRCQYRCRDMSWWHRNIQLVWKNTCTWWHLLYFGRRIICSHQFRCHECLPRMFGLKTCISHHIALGFFRWHRHRTQDGLPRSRSNAAGILEKQRPEPRTTTSTWSRLVFCTVLEVTGFLECVRSWGCWDILRYVEIWKWQNSLE